MKISGEKSLSSKVENGLKILFLVITLLDIVTLGVSGVAIFSELNSFSVRENYLTRIVLELIISVVLLLTGVVALFIIHSIVIFAVSLLNY